MVNVIVLSIALLSKIEYRKIDTHEFSLEIPKKWEYKVGAPGKNWIRYTILTDTKKRVSVIDVLDAKSTPKDPLVNFRDLEKKLKKKKGYRRIDLFQDRVMGQEFAVWKFVVPEKGKEVFKVDIGIKNVSLMFSAPNKEFDYYEEIFTHIYKSLKVK